MSAIWIDVDIAVEVPVNTAPLTDDADFKTRETSVAYNAAGMDLVWNFITPDGTMTQTAVTPTTGGDYDWAHVGDGMYKIEIPASGGASINNATEGFGYFTGIATGVLPWRGPTIGFRAAGLNDKLVESAYSTTRGLAGTALPAAAADAAGGLPVSDAGGLDLDSRMPAATAVTNINTVYDTDFSTNYNATRDAWATNVQDTVGTGNLPADAVAISGDSTAADNLEAMYDGTGYTEETAPASRAQVDGIGSGSGGSIPFQAIEDNTGGAIDPSSAAFVGNVTGSTTFANTASADGTSHTFTDTGNDIDVVYGFQVGGGRVGTTVHISANVDGNGDEIKVKAYDHVGDDWEIIGTLEGSGGSTFKTLEPALFQKYTGTGAELGKVYIRFETDSTTPSDLAVDQCVVLAANLSQTVGYSLGAVWLDTSASNTNTESFVDGVADNPVSTIGAAVTVAGNVGLKRIVVAAGSSVTLAADMSNYEIMGENYSLALGGQTITGANICGATVSGTFAGTTAILEHCIINAITGPGLTMRSCYLNEVSITNNGTAGWYFNDCRSRIAGTGRFTFDFGAGVGNTGLSVRNFSGGIEIENMGDTGTDTASIEGFGNLVLNANCDGGTLARRGVWDYTDNSGNVTVVYDELHDTTTAIESELIVVHSETTVIASDAAAVEAWNLSSVASDAAAVESELIVVHSETTAIQSDAAVVESNTEAIHSQTTVIESDSTAVESSVAVIESDAAAVESELVVVHSETTVIASDTAVIEASGGLSAAQASKLTQIQSDVIIVASDVLQVYSDTTIIASDTAAIEAAGGALTAAQASQLTQLHSDAIIIGSDVVLIYSDTAAIETATSTAASDLAAIESELALVHSETTVIQSDAAVIESNTEAIHSETTAIQSDAAAIESELALVHSETTVIQSDTTAIHSQTTVIESDSTAVESSIAVVESQTTVIESDVALLETTRAEPGQGAPSATTDAFTKIDWLYKLARNKVTQTATTFSLYNDAGDTVDTKATVSDDGTTFTRDELATGP